MSLAQVHTLGRPNTVWISAVRFISVAVAASVFLFPSVHAEESNVRLLVRGTWGLSIVKDPFLSSFPATTYVAPGTIIYGSDEESIDNYLTKRLHYGHEVQVAESSELRRFDNLVGIPPSNAFTLHRSILCLAQTNRIVIPPGECARGTHVGKGWVFQFRPGRRERWVDVSAILDERTMQSLGLSNAYTSFGCRWTI